MGLLDDSAVVVETDNALLLVTVGQFDPVLWLWLRLWWQVWRLSIE